MTSLNTPPPANDNESRAEEGRSPRGASLFLPEGGLAALVFGQSRAWGGAGWGPEVSDFTAGRRSSNVPRPQSGPRACSQPASQSGFELFPRPLCLPVNLSRPSPKLQFP